jgi:hypothetical protein
MRKTSLRLRSPGTLGISPTGALPTIQVAPGSGFHLADG